MRKLLAILVFLVIGAIISPAVAYAEPTDLNADYLSSSVRFGSSEYKNLSLLAEGCTGDPYAPCYEETISHVINQAIDGPQFTATMRCGINIKNSFGILVGKISEDANITWEYSSYWNAWEIISVNWTTKATWASTPGYSWYNVVGPVVTWSGPGQGINDVKVKTTGDMIYLGILWRSYTIRMEVEDHATNVPSFACYKY